ncbi:hypothetical protein ANCCAN_04229 [Ancylostoma caninum]|uniref:Uncharacterized protein n=1 Tax=Ancylostoma caninum TaxID=29170 RepID=A0A368GZJ8_ANCCA|nr:hypothetical protein ANCCAN_04229 [Ancylostoma caninum]
MKTFEGLPKTRRIMMTICTSNARTLASEAPIEDLMMQTRKVRYEIIGMRRIKTRRHRPPPWRRTFSWNLRR